MGEASHETANDGEIRSRVRRDLDGSGRQSGGGRGRVFHRRARRRRTSASAAAALRIGDRRHDRVVLVHGHADTARRRVPAGSAELLEVESDGPDQRRGDRCARRLRRANALAALGDRINDYHGAYRRVGKTETVYYHRDLRYDVIILTNWTDGTDSERNISWTRWFYQALQPHMTGGVYVNDLDRDEGVERVKHAYGENYRRLVTLKAKFDPTNFFRMNQNIRG